jgi:hypothetical protein
MERAPEHYVQGLRKILHGGRREGAHLDNARIVHHNINAPKMLGGLGHDRMDLRLVGDIAGDRQDLGATAPQILVCAREFLHISSSDD